MPSKGQLFSRYPDGIILGSDFLKYRRQKDGSFALTDSTHLDYKVDFSDRKVHDASIPDDVETVLYVIPNDYDVIYIK